MSLRSLCTASYGISSVIPVGDRPVIPRVVSAEIPVESSSGILSRISPVIDLGIFRGYCREFPQRYL